MRPSEVPGYAQARDQGLTRTVPPTPPPLVPGLNAQHRFFAMIVGVTVVAIMSLALVSVLEVIHHPIRIAVQLAVSVCAFVVILRLIAAVGRTVHREMDHGYTTLQLAYGNFFAKPRVASQMAMRVPWDYRGLWMLNAMDGSVLQAPDPTVEAPGFYPSPNRPGAFEMWTGVAWTNDFRSVEHQALAVSGR